MKTKIATRCLVLSMGVGVLLFSVLVWRFSKKSQTITEFEADSNYYWSVSTPVATEGGKVNSGVDPWMNFSSAVLKLEVSDRHLLVGLASGSAIMVSPNEKKVDAQLFAGGPVVGLAHPIIYPSENVYWEILTSDPPILVQGVIDGKPRELRAKLTSPTAIVKGFGNFPYISSYTSGFLIENQVDLPVIIMSGLSKVTDMLRDHDDIYIARRDLERSISVLDSSFQLKTVVSGFLVDDISGDSERLVFSSQGKSDKGSVYLVTMGGIVKILQTALLSPLRIAIIDDYLYYASVRDPKGRIFRFTLGEERNAK